MIIQQRRNFVVAKFECDRDRGRGGEAGESDTSVERQQRTQKKSNKFYDVVECAIKKTKRCLNYVIKCKVFQFVSTQNDTQRD